MAQCRPSLLTHRAQLDTALDLFSSLDEAAVEPQLVGYEAALDHYLELPALLEPILPTHISALCTLIERLLDVRDPSLPSLNVPSRALYALVKVRGVKNVASHFPHQVHHLRTLVPRFIYVERLIDVTSFWKLRYILLVWLSVAVRVPFPLHSILHPDQLHNAVSHARDALAVSTGPIANAAASFLSRLLTRPDASHHRDALINWAVSHTLRHDVQSPVRSAGLSFLAATFKHAPRQFTYPYLASVLSAVDAVVQDDIAASTIEAHLIAKLTQRLALTFLPPQPLAWRYVRQTRNLFSGTGHTGKLDPTPATPLSATDAQSLELVIDLLLSALRHRDTIVRWSAAKGVARITARLPPALASDVVASVMELFDQRAEARADAALHGACLALAELVRRGLILPHHHLFKRAFDAVRTAACFDMRRGANSVGSYVRDAACYAVWAIARAYDKSHVEPFAHVICDAMIPVALLDREINCRRAAAAALQECVGRLSVQLFEDGIQLITLADYFSLGDRNAAYLEIAPKVACLARSKHFDSILHELWQRKLVHWDATIRALSAKALAGLVHVDRETIIVKDVIPHLVELASQRGDMVYRHGSILGLAELSLIVGLKGLASLSTDIRRIPKLLEEKKLLTGRTGDDTRVACCQLIQGLATGARDIFLADDDARTDAEYSLTFLERILGCGKENMYAPAASAYSALCNNVIANDEEWHVKVTNKILDGISNSEYCESQRGFALAAGVCGNSPRLDYVVQVLCIEVERNTDVEVRRNAAISLCRIPERVLSERFTDVLNAMQCGMTDFARDERGDVGSWVREASMKSAVEITGRVLKLRESDTDGRLDDKEETEVLGVIQCVAEQCCSRIDRTRGVAGSSLKGLCQIFMPSVMTEKLTRICSLINSTLSVPFEKKICTEDSRDVDFREARTIFSYMKRTLDIPELFEPVVRGFVASGGTPGQQSKPASNALGDFITDAKEMSTKTRTVTSILRLIDEKHPRLTIPALTLLGTLLKQDAFVDLDQTALLRIARSTKRSWRQKLGDVKRVKAAITVISELASLSITDDSFDFRKGTLGRECLEGLTIVLGGPIPRLRRISAEAIYLVLLEFDAEALLVEEDDREHDVSAKVQEALAVVSETGWEQLDVLGARERRNVLCQLLGIRTPVAIRKRPEDTKVTDRSAIGTD